jgi:hypothetical protein
MYQHSSTVKSIRTVLPELRSLPGYVPTWIISCFTSVSGVLQALSQMLYLCRRLLAAT